MSYNLPPPAAVPLAAAANQLSYVNVASTVSSATPPANVVCYWLLRTIFYSHVQLFSFVTSF